MRRLAEWALLLAGLAMGHRHHGGEEAGHHGEAGGMGHTHRTHLTPGTCTRIHADGTDVGVGRLRMARPSSIRPIVERFKSRSVMMMGGRGGLTTTTTRDARSQFIHAVPSHP